jgi:hypothetical protein
VLTCDQVRDGRFLAAVRELQLPKAALYEFSVKGLVALEYLDLSGNHIETVWLEGDVIVQTRIYCVDDVITCTNRSAASRMRRGSSLSISLAMPCSTPRFACGCVVCWRDLTYTRALQATVDVMSKVHQRLEQLSMCVLQPGHKRHPDNARYRQ